MELTSFRCQPLKTFWQSDAEGRTALAALWQQEGQLGLADMQFEKLRTMLGFLACASDINEFLALPYAGRGVKPGDYCIAISEVWYLSFHLKDDRVTRLDLVEIY